MVSPQFQQSTGIFLLQPIREKQNRPIVQEKVKKGKKYFCAFISTQKYKSK